MKCLVTMVRAAGADGPLASEGGAAAVAGPALLEISLDTRHTTMTKRREPRDANTNFTQNQELEILNIFVESSSQKRRKGRTCRSESTRRLVRACATCAAFLLLQDSLFIRFRWCKGPAFYRIPMV